jgi:hypothetical protein
MNQIIRKQLQAISTQLVELNAKEQEIKKTLRSETSYQGPTMLTDLEEENMRKTPDEHLMNLEGQLSRRFLMRRNQHVRN